MKERLAQLIGFCHKYKRETVAGALTLLAFLLIFIASCSRPTGLQVEGSNAGFSPDQVRGWMNQDLLSAAKKGDTDPEKACPAGVDESDCARARREVQKETIQKLLPQMWALAQAQADRQALPSVEVELAEKQLLKEIQASTQNRDAQSALDRVGLDRSDLRHRARSIVALQKALPSMPSPPSGKALRLAYRDILPQLTESPKANLDIWQTPDRARALRILVQLQRGGKPSQKPSPRLRAFEISQANTLPEPWRGFAISRPGIKLESCAGNQWCVVRVYPQTPSPPPPSFNKIKNQLSSRMIYDLRGLQVDKVKNGLADRWKSKTSCSDLPACS